MPNPSNKDLLPVLQKEVETIEHQITALEVSDEESLKEASDRVKLVKDTAKRIEREKEIFTAPANQIIDAAKAKYDPLLKALKSFESVLKEKASAYLVEKKRAADVEAARIASRVEKGTMRVDTAMRKTDAIDKSTATHTENSGMRMQVRRDVEITSEADVPREYLVLDMVKIRKDALAGVEIRGVKVVEKPVMQSL